MRGFAIAIVTLLALAASPWTHAQNFRGLTINARIATGETSYGYAAHRFLITNPGETERQVRIDFDTFGNEAFRVLGGSTTVPASSSVELVIYQPPVKIRSTTARVTIDGSPLNERIRFPVPAHGVEQYDSYYSRYGGSGQSAMHLTLVSSAVPSNLLDRLEAQTADSNASRTGYSGMARTRQLEQSSQPSRVWPSDWLSYSRYLSVVMMADEFEVLPAGVREAILGSVHAGGNLLLIDGPSPLEGGSRQFAEQHGLNWESPADPRMGGALAARGQPLPWLAESEFGFGAILWSTREQLETSPVVQGSTLFERWRRIVESRSQIPTLAAAEGAMPVAGELTVPRRMTFVFLVVFALLVCPVNLILLKRANRRTLLFVTAPVLGLLFSATVFVYGLLHDGISTSSRIEAVSVLDQRSRFCSTSAQLGFYAPLTPRGGLSLPNHAEITPMLGSRGQRLSAGQRVTVEHGEEQLLRSGWISPREPAQFWIRSHTQRRERVLVEPTDQSGWAATNGLGVPITSFEFFDAQGARYSAERIEPGERALLRADPISTGVQSGRFETLVSGLPSQSTSRLAGMSAPYTRPWSYTAVVEGNLFAPVGIESVSNRATREVVIGLLESGEGSP